MAITFADLGAAYSRYANATLPWNQLHVFSARLASAPARGPLGVEANEPNAVARAGAPLQTSRAKLYAYRAAVAPHHIMRIPDILFGTGAHRQGETVHIANGNDAVDHISQCFRSPLDSGVFGMAQGSFFLRTVWEGAYFGAALGAICCASPKTIDTCAATGAVVSAALLWLVPAVTFSAMTGVCRAATSLAKFAVVGAFYGAGYAVGSAVDHFSPGRAPEDFAAARAG